MAVYEVLSDLKHGELFKKGTLVDASFFEQEVIDGLVRDGVLREHVEDTRVPLVPAGQPPVDTQPAQTSTVQPEQTTVTAPQSPAPSQPVAPADPVVSAIANDPQIQGDANQNAGVTAAPITLE